jgi:hypothetical protein
MAKLVVRNKIGDESESHFFEGDLGTWIKENVPAFDAGIHPLYTATLNGQEWPHVRHGDTLSHNDEIVMTIEPQEATTWFIVLGVVFAGVAYYVATNLPVGYQDNTPSRGSIYAAGAKANRLMPNGIIREISGDIVIYPDLICPVRRIYEGHEEFLVLNLCIGAGYFDIDVSNLYIDQTSFSGYSGDIVSQISDPAADVTGNIGYQNWYQSREVADLELIQAGTLSQGEWTVTTTSSTVTTKLDGVITAFPAVFNAKMIIRYFDNTSINVGGAGLRSYRVTGISGSSYETATLVPSDIYGDQPPIDLATLTDVVVDIIVYADVANWEGPFVLVPESEETDTIEYDVNFPNGLVELSNGAELQRTVQIDVQWREVGTSTWNLLPTPNDISSFTDNTLNERGYTARLSITLCRPEIRFRRVTLDSKDTNIIDKLRIKRVRALLESPTSYAEVTTLQLKIRGTNSLAQSAENKINVRGAVRKLPTLANMEAHAANPSGNALVYSATSSAMRFAAYQITTLSSENNVDWTAFGDIDTILEGRSDDLNADFSDETTLWEALKIMMSVGYCEPSIKEGLLTPVRSGIENGYNFLYTPDNILGEGINRSDTYFGDKIRQGIVVEYIDSASGNNRTVNAFLTGDVESKSRRVQAIGITNRTKAWRYGMRLRRREALRPALITWETEMDGLNSDYGSADGVVSTLNANQTFFVVDHSRVNIEGTLTDTMILDSAPDFSGGAYYAVFRKPTGHFSGIYQIIAGQLANQIFLINPSLLDFTPIYDGSMESTICAIGSLDELVERVIIKSIEPAQNDTVNIIAEEYISEIYSDDDNGPPS